MSRSDELVKRGLLLVKVKISPKNRTDVIQIADIFRAKIVDVSQSTLTAELTGDDSKINAFLEMLQPYGIEETAMTGMIALERGTNVLKA